MARLVGESGPVEGQTWVIEHGLTLGREGHNAIAMPWNRKASRDHAKVWREAEHRYAVADLGSTNGTLVNDERVTRQVLKDEDEIRVGEATFRFLLDEEEKPKRKEPGQRMAELFGHAAPGAALGAPGAPPSAGGAAGTAVPGMQVKQRILQYQKKDAKGSVASWDVGQTGGWVRWVLVGVALAIAVAAFLLAIGALRGN